MPGSLVTTTESLEIRRIRDSVKRPIAIRNVPSIVSRASQEIVVHSASSTACKLISTVAEI